MDYDFQLKLQAYLDGELSGREMRKVEAQMARDAQAQALSGEMQMVKSALSSFEAEVKLPESREFFWSRIQRETRVLDAQQTAQPNYPLWAAWRRLLIPAGIALG